MFAVGPAFWGGGPVPGLSQLTTYEFGHGVISNGGLTFSVSSPGTSLWWGAWVRSSSARTGKAYFEVVDNSTFPAGQDIFIGFVPQDNWYGADGGYYTSLPTYSGVYGIVSGSVGGLSTGVVSNGSISGNGSYAVSSGDVWGVAVDFSSLKVWFRKNGGSWISGDPVAETSPTLTMSTASVDPMFSFYQLGSTSQSLTCKFSSTTWATAAPAGYSELP